MSFTQVAQSLDFLEKQPNAVLIDLKAMNSSGRTLLTEYKNYKTPIILVAHYTNYDIVEKNDYFDICPFPVEPNHLKQIIKNATNYHKLLRQYESLICSNNNEVSTGEILYRDEQMIELIRRVKNNLQPAILTVIGEKSVGKSTFINQVIQKTNNEFCNKHSFIFEDKEELITNFARKLESIKNSKEKIIFELTSPFPQWQEWDKILSQEFDLPQEDIYILPPLRERPKDVLFYSSKFLEVLNQQTSLKVNGIKHDAERKLLQLNLKRNMEELKLIVDKSFFATTSGWIEYEHLPEPTVESHSGNELDNNGLILQKVIPFEHVKKQTIIFAYEKCNGNIFEAAQQLKIGRATMYRLLHKYKVI